MKPADLQCGWHVYVQTTDRGSNETAARKLNSAMYNNIHPQVLYLHLDCAEHAGHLCVLGGLSEIDKCLARHKAVDKDLSFKYYSSCAVLANVLRDVSQGVFKAWQHLFGDHDALKLARRLWPKCLSGRWGAIAAFEERCLECGQQKFLGLI